MYVKSDTLLFADTFENFGNICLEIYEVEVKLELITDYDMILMI